MIDIGPVQLMAIGFGPDARYEGQIVDELERLEANGLIRVLDLLFIGQDEDSGEVVALDLQGDDLGALVGALLGFALEDAGAEMVTVDVMPGEHSVGIGRSHLEELVSATPPDVAIGIVLIEHVWARDFKKAIREAGGLPLAEGFLSQEALAEITGELAAIVSILEEIEADTDRLDEPSGAS